MPYFDRRFDDETFPETGTRLRAEVDAAEPRLRAIQEERAGRRLAPGKWSHKEVLGHLIDSAANNHQRFVRAGMGTPIALPGYDQEHWVRYQRYDDRSWVDIVDLWCAYNRHLAHVIAGIPESRRQVSCQIGDGPAVTLSYVALDYVGHLQHHLAQVLGGG